MACAITRGWAIGTAATVLGAGLLATRGAGESSPDLVGLTLTLGAVLGYVLYVEAAQHAIHRGLDAAGAMAGMFGVGAILLAPLLALEPLGWLASPRGAALAEASPAAQLPVATSLSLQEDYSTWTSAEPSSLSPRKTLIDHLPFLESVFDL
ncbi:MAG: hypothetical protein A2V77_10150 [Anaeromyxobacter sp. RBG_16_69_14]|nr:MAG: hypothetical protein A2V77_10150 [Anaeromyxobacter sp. RBG_16_69_14]